MKVRVTVGGKVQQELEVDRELVLGRKAPADIVVADGQVSSRHLKLRPSGDMVFVSDLGSTNGTRIDGGEPLPPNKEVPFERGRKLAAGSAVLELVEPPKAEAAAAGFAKVEKTVVVGAGQMQSVLVNVARFKAAKPRLVVASEHERRTVPIEEMEVTIGRDADQAQVVVQHQSVSGRHAVLKFENGRFLLQDLGSSNGTFVDGNPLTAPTPLANECAVTFGTVDCLFAQRPPETGESGGAGDPYAQALADHAVRLGRATPQQAREALARHRETGEPLGVVLVERGIVGPREWSEIYRQRQILGTLAPAGARRPSLAVIVGMVVVVLGLAALLAAFLSGMFAA